MSPPCGHHCRLLWDFFLSQLLSFIVLLIIVCVWFFFLKGNQARLSSVPQKAELQIKLNPVCCELDISIVDRLNSLLQPQKLTTVEMMASHMYASYNKHVSLVSM